MPRKSTSGTLHVSEKVTNLYARNLEIRKANIVKILSELKVDDFTGRDQSGMPLPDRFDQTFFMGDLK